MKKYLSIIFVACLLLAPGLYAAKQQKKEPPPVIKSAMQLAEELQKRGITGKETSEGVLPKVMSVLGLRQYREISSHDYSVQIWDFKSAAGFNIARTLFGLLTMLDDDEVYKSRPYIITINFEKRETFDKILVKLKEIIPDVKEIKEKEY